MEHNGKFVCGAGFNAINLTPEGFQVCCYHNREVHKAGSIKEWREGEVLRKFNQDMLEGNYDAICRECISHPLDVSYGMYEALYKLPEQVSFDPDNLSTPEMVNIYISEKCQLACRTCSPQYSSVQNNFRKKVGLPHKDLEPRDFRPLIDEINEIKPIRAILAGGDPVYSDEYLYVLKNLNKDIAISFVTNGQLWKEEFYDEVLKFKRRWVAFSIDGSKETSNYVRTFSNTDKTYENLMRYIIKAGTTTNTAFITYTLSNISVWSIAEFVEELYERMGVLANSVWVSPNHATYPPYFSVSNLPPEKRAELTAKLRSDQQRIIAAIELNGGRNSRFERSIREVMRNAIKCINVREFDPELWKQFIEFNRKYDSGLPLRQGESLVENLVCVSE